MKPFAAPHAIRPTETNLETYGRLLFNYRSEHQATGSCHTGLERLRTRMARRGWLLSPEALRSLVQKDRSTSTGEVVSAHARNLGRAPGKPATRLSLSGERSPSRSGSPQKGKCSPGSTLAKALRKSD